MNTLYMPVGLAGCGKSTYGSSMLSEGKVDIILSSDTYRLKLLGSESDQSNNSLVFDTLYNDLRNYLTKGKNVYLDATNLTIKDRKRALDICKSLSVNVEALVFAVDIDIVKDQNARRDRVVPESVIDKMICKFQLPLLTEGFSKIELIRRGNDSKFLLEELESCKGFDQKNPHHTLDLYQHMNSAQQYILKNSSRENTEHNMLISFAALIHDIGKLYTQEYDKSKNKAHYIGHENYGAYLCLTISKSLIDVSTYQLALLVNYHMIPYVVEKPDTKPETIIKYKYYLQQYWDDLLFLHEADKFAH